MKCVPGDYYNFDDYDEYADFTGEHFPSTPEWQASVDGQYEWSVLDTMKAFVGFTRSYVSHTNSFFVNRNPTPAFINAGATSGPPGLVFGGYISCSGALSPTPVGPCPYNVVTSTGIGEAHPNDPLKVAGYALLDLRAGVHKGPWSFEIWGRNVANTYYWTAADHIIDALVRYTGMPATYGVTFSYRFH